MAKPTSVEPGQPTSKAYQAALAKIYDQARRKVMCSPPKGWSGREEFLEDAISESWVPFAVAFSDAVPVADVAVRWLSEAARRRMAGLATSRARETVAVESTEGPGTVDAARQTVRERRSLTLTETSGYVVREDGYLWPKRREPHNSDAIEYPEGHTLEVVEPFHREAAAALSFLAEHLEHEQIPRAPRICLRQVERAYAAAFGHEARDMEWVSVARRLCGALEHAHRSALLLRARGRVPSPETVRNLAQLPAWILSALSSVLYIERMARPHVVDRAVAA